MTTSRFEAVFNYGDDDSRPSWDVIDWKTDDGYGNRVGNVIASFYGAWGEFRAISLAEECAAEELEMLVSKYYSDMAYNEMDPANHGY